MQTSCSESKGSLSDCAAFFLEPQILVLAPTEVLLLLLLGIFAFRTFMKHYNGNVKSGNALLYTGGFLYFRSRHLVVLLYFSSFLLTCHSFLRLFSVSHLRNHRCFHVNECALNEIEEGSKVENHPIIKLNGGK